MSGSDDDKEIAGESPHYGSQSGKIPTEIEGTQQEVEAEKIYEYVPYILRKPEMISIHHLGEAARATVTRRRLIGRHT